MANACQRAGNQHRREGCREDEAWRIAADHVDDAAIRSYIAAHDADRFGERALDHREALRGAIPVRNPSTAGTVHADGMHLVEIGERTIFLGEIANGVDGGEDRKSTRLNSSH